MPENIQTTDNSLRCRRCGHTRWTHYVSLSNYTGCLARYFKNDQRCDCGGYEQIEQAYRVQLDINHAPIGLDNWLFARIHDDSAQPARTLSCGVPAGGDKERLKAWNHFVYRIAEYVGIIPECGDKES